MHSLTSTLSFKQSVLMACVAVLLITIHSQTIIVVGTVIEKDLNFGPTLQGYNLLNAGFGSGVKAVGLPANKKYFGCGNIGSQLLLGQFTTIGNLDLPNFNAPQGYQVLSIGDISECTSVSVQPSDQKPVIAGFSRDDSSGINSMLVMRFTTAGAVDTSTFGSPDGYVMINPPTEPGAPVNSFSRAVVLQPSNEYIVVGGSMLVDEMGNLRAVVARLDTEGVLDPSFGTLGIATHLIGESTTLQGLVLQSDEKVVLLLQTVTSSVNGIALVRLNVDGTIDTTFGISGTVIIDSLVSSAVPSAITLQTNGGNLDKIVVGAYYGNQLFFLRFSEDGVLDTTFGSTGIVTATLGGVLLPTIVTISAAKTGPETDSLLTGGHTGDGRSYVMKMNPNGSPASGFGGANGIQYIARIVATDDILLESVQWDLDNYPMCGGLTINMGTGASQFLALRLRQSTANSVTLQSPLTVESPLLTNQPFIKGTSNQAQQLIHIVVDDVVVGSTVTNARGDWIFGVPAPLTYDEHEIVSRMIYDLDTVLATDSQTVTLQTPVP
jgi:uncharacterized delta-60 repeat protein